MEKMSINIYSKNPFKQINSNNTKKESINIGNRWAENTNIVLEHIRKQIPQPTGHCSRQKLIKKSVKPQGRLASLGKPVALDHSCREVCLGVLSDGEIFPPGPDVANRAVYVCALLDRLEQGDQSPFNSPVQEASSLHRTSIASSISLPLKGANETEWGN